MNNRIINTFLFVLFFAAFVSLTDSFAQLQMQQGAAKEVLTIPAKTKAAQSQEQEEDAKKKTLGSSEKEEAGEKTQAQASGTVQADITGKVVSLNEIMIGLNGDVSKDKAKSLAEHAQPIMFLGDNGNIYVVYNSDGSYAAKKLAEHAGAAKIGIKGKIKSVNGVPVIIASRFIKM